MTETTAVVIEAVIARQIHDGNYRSFDEAIEALKAVITDPAVLARARARWLREEIRKGEASGEGIPAEEVFASLRARIEAKLETDP
jgi:antitoxin ParD1/3/4